MKILRFSSVLLFFCSSVLLSCKDESITTESSQLKKPVEFLGEMVSLPNNLTSDDLTIYLENQKINFDSQKVRVNTDSKVNWSLIPSKTLFEFIENATKLYPNLTKEEFNEIEFEMIKKHITTIKTKEDIKGKRLVIFEFYNFLVSKDIEKLAKEYIKKMKVKSVQGFFDLNPLEQYLVASDPVGGLKVNQARSQAEEMVGNVYPGQEHNGNDEVNAFKHCAWNALSVQELVSVTYNKWNSLERAKKFTCAHEYIADANGNYTQIGNSDANAMDLYNNLVGRTYMYETVSQHWWGTSNNPSNSQIQSAIQSFTKTQKSNSSDIFSASGSLNWSSVGDYNSAMNYHTPIHNGIVYLP